MKTLGELYDAGMAYVDDDPVARTLKNVMTEIPQGAYQAGKKVWDGMHPMDQVALGTSPVPIVGDLAGLVADARMYTQEPDTRTWGNAALSGLGLLPFVPNAGMVKAFHGTPHKVDKFSMDKIGTGEGAQAYGHGLYFAENEGVASGYKNILGNSIFIDGKPVSANSDGVVASYLHKTDGNADQAMSILKQDILDLRSSDKHIDAIRASSAEKALVEMESLHDAGRIQARGQGNLYNVNLGVEPEDLLDWDAPLSEQLVKEIQQDFPSYMASGMPNKQVKNPDAYYFLSEKLGGDAAASQYLRNKGIPGIKYLDGNSRSVGEGTRNFVIFDEELIDIAE